MKKLIALISILVLMAGSSVGTYLVLDSIGEININKNLELTFTVNDEEKTYDGSPLTPSSYTMEGELGVGHRIGEVSYSGSITEAGTTEGFMSVTIIDESNKDVTDKYEIHYNTARLVVNKREVSITIPSEEMEYIGKELSSDSYKITSGTIAEGQILIPTIEGSRIDVGEISETFTPRVYNAQGIEVTSNYNFTLLKEGEIEVIKREIEITPTLLTATYTGSLFTIGNNYKISYGSLAEGHTIDVSFSNTNMVNASTYETYIYITVKDKTGNDVTSNYKYNSSEAYRVVIKPIEVTVTLPNLSKTFDGASFKDDLDEFVKTTNGILPNGYTIEYSGSLLSYTNVSKTNESMTITKDDFIINSTDNNYTIVIMAGSLKINKKDLYVYTPEIEKVYDSKAFTADYIKENTYVIGLVSLAKNDKWTDYLDIKDYPEDKDVVTKKYSVNAYELDSKNNYNIIVTPANLIINPIEINISLNNKGITYEKNLTDLNSMMGNSLVVDSNVNPTIELKTTVTPSSGYDKGTYQVYIDQVKVSDLIVYSKVGVTTSDNYEVNIRYEEGTYSRLVVNSKIIEVPTATTLNYVYTASNIDCPYDLDTTKALYDYSDSEAEAKMDAGTYNITLSLKDSNYSWSNGEEVDTVISWTIEKAKLIIKAKNTSVTYGDPLSGGGVDYIGFLGTDTKDTVGLFSGTLDYDYSYSRYQVFNAALTGEDAEKFAITPKGRTSKNYEIEYQSGVLTVNPFDLVLDSPIGIEKNYDGLMPEVTLNNISLSDDQIGDNDIHIQSFTIDYHDTTPFQTDIIDVKSVIIVDNYGNDITSCLNITYCTIDFTLNTQRILSVSLKNFELSYDEYSLFDTNHIPEDLIGSMVGLASTDYAEFDFGVFPTIDEDVPGKHYVQVEIVISSIKNFGYDYDIQNDVYDVRLGTSTFIVNVPVKESNLLVTLKDKELTIPVGGTVDYDIKNFVSGVYGLVNGDVITFNDEDVEVCAGTFDETTPGTYTLTVKAKSACFAIETSIGTPSTVTYTGEFPTATLTIHVSDGAEKRNLYVSLKNFQMNYDDFIAYSFAQENVVSSVVGLRDSDIITFGKVLQVGSISTGIVGKQYIELEIEVASIIDSNKNDVSGLYEVCISNSIVEVTIYPTDIPLYIFLKDRTISVDLNDTVDLGDISLYIGSIYGLVDGDCIDDITFGSVTNTVAIDTSVAGTYIIPLNITESFNVIGSNAYNIQVVGSATLTVIVTP